MVWKWSKDILKPVLFGKFESDLNSLLGRSEHTNSTWVHTQTTTPQDSLEEAISVQPQNIL